MEPSSNLEQSFSGRTILVGVCGGIAAYKCAEVVSALRQAGADVHVILTEAAQKFVSQLTFFALSGNAVHADLFAEGSAWDVAHISLVRKSDAFLVLNATANTLAKLAHGLADNLLTTCVLATRRPVLVAAAMNTAMLEAEPTQANIAALQERGFEFVEPGAGFLACGEVGDGRLADPQTILSATAGLLRRSQSLRGRRVVVTAGPTREFADPARFLSNPSSGRMGFALAIEARRRGADVTLISGPTQLPAPADLRFVPVTTASEMHAAVLEHLDGASLFIGAAAVADFRPADVSLDKVKKEGAATTMALSANPDIIADVAARRLPGCFVLGFAAETDDLEANARKKMEKKNLDCIVANDIGADLSSFGGSHTQATLLWPGGRREPLPRAPKKVVAGMLLDRITDALPGM
ncbi:MAG: bifunctional phosphopantothenoylcysteine decarboxylase/phosphopantothenate--cysteine ligase CoaBC [Candidatus Eremiobacteraeota bacterium]|nr:bifunctional phosphopantothenoylcysteine decarboxylase/phosphopantothenate--cysteine ligase CoaBC [Candidatus Eremiobacteraeota bacterium]MBC5827567.1 bifunctional phosphopantothenoylcysteine decarboxylase/phosphopantothenate--cysteine ligase CoaBC [Candidatus Eremiobacteraeota bacterium]